MDKDTDTDEQVFGFFFGNRTFFDTIHDSLCHGGLSRTKHLHRLGGIFDGHFVKHHRCGLCHEVGCDDGKKSVDTFLLIHQSLGEHIFGWGAARADNQVNMCDFITVSHESFPDKHVADFCHISLLKIDTCPELPSQRVGVC